MSRTSFSVTILLLTTFASGQTTQPDLAKIKHDGLAALAVTADYRRHLPPLLLRPIGDDLTFVELRSAIPALSEDLRTINASAEMKDADVRLYVAPLLDVFDRLQAALATWQVELECESGASDAAVPAGAQAAFRRSAAELHRWRERQIQDARDEFDQVRQGARVLTGPN